MARPGIRVRLTAAFVAGLAVVIIAVSWFVYVRLNQTLLATIDAGLQSRAEILAAYVRANGEPELPQVDPTLLENDEAFAQIADASGLLLRSSTIVQSAPLVPSAILAALNAPRPFNERIAGIDNVTRVLAVPTTIQGKRLVIMVGASLQDRRDEVLQLAATLAVAGAAILLLAGAGAWWLIGATLRPVDAMRRQAEAITAAAPGSRLAVEGTDEIAALGSTLNEMLLRIDGAVARERELVDRASHELRTPLAIQRTGLDLALTGPQNVQELSAALLSASEENAHLTRLADDLLVLSRARDGQLPVRRQTTSLAGLLQDAAARNASAAAERDVALTVEGSDAQISVDRDWLRQALDDLLDNALRATPGGGSITLSGTTNNGNAMIGVQDTGAGFEPALLPTAFEAFSRGTREVGLPAGAGLGLAIVRTIAEAHGGSVDARNSSTGGCVTMTLPLKGPAVN